MSRMYCVDCKELSPEECAQLREGLNNWTFLAVRMAGMFQVIRFTSNPNQTLESVVEAFPILKRCKITLFTN